MESKVFSVGVLSVVVIASFVQALYSELLGEVIVRSVPRLPPPLRRFYDLASFGQPWDGAFWNNARRVIGVVSGVVFLVLIALTVTMSR